MEQVKTNKWLTLLLTLGLAVAMQAQQNEADRFILRRGSVRSTATICPGIMKNVSGLNIYLHGNLDVFLSPHFSLRGDLFYYLTTTGSFNAFEKNHQVFTGFSFHQKQRGFSPYAGMLLGVALTENTFLPGLPAETIGVNPVVSPHVGFNLYGEKYFHIFGEVRYVIGNHFPKNGGAVSLNELRFSFGLGFNFNTLKDKKRSKDSAS